MDIFTIEDLERPRSSFPKLNSRRDKVTSGPTFIESEPRHHLPYNCVAWAIGLNTQWWEYDPDGEIGFKTYWSDTITDGDTVEGWVELFRTEFGYDLETDDRYERGIEKIAIYGELEDEIKIATHVARQIGNGRWTSKLGDGHDIEHGTLECLTGYDFHEYGRLEVILARKKRFAKRDGVAKL